MEKRPLLITILCIIGFISVPLGVIGLILALASAPGTLPPELTIPVWYGIFGIIINILYLIALIYIWKMKRIGLIAYTVLFAVGAGVGLITGFATILSLVLSVVIIVLLWMYHKKMS